MPEISAALEEVVISGWIIMVRMSRENDIVSIVSLAKRLVEVH